ncbi:TPA: lpg1685 family Dot/Icm T4SS effector [Legionella pneumophila]
MQCAIERKNSLRDLQSQPNLGDWMFISSLGSQDFDERKFFSQISLQSLSFIIRIAKFSAYFAALCEKSEYDELWKKLYSTFGLVLTRDKPVPKSFFTHDGGEINHFNLLRGAYYFHLSQKALAAKEKSFSDSELYWLNQAMKFGSIHASQRYIQFLYQILDKVASADEAEQILTEAIKLCKANLNQYGSYAYMMLAEAFFRYAMWAQQSGNINRAKSAITSSINSCTKANQHLRASASSIHNASLGEGLKASNTLAMESPEEAIAFLNAWAVAHLYKHEIELVSRPGFY